MKGAAILSIFALALSAFAMPTEFAARSGSSGVDSWSGGSGGGSKGNIGGHGGGGGSGGGTGDGNNGGGKLYCILQPRFHFPNSRLRDEKLFE
jgi:uncharacterized membrane protein